MSSCIYIVVSLIFIRIPKLSMFTFLKHACRNSKRDIFTGPIVFWERVWVIRRKAFQNHSADDNDLFPLLQQRNTKVHKPPKPHLLKGKLTPRWLALAHCNPIRYSCETTALLNVFICHRLSSSLFLLLCSITYRFFPFVFLFSKVWMWGIHQNNY